MSEDVESEVSNEAVEAASGPSMTDQAAMIAASPGLGGRQRRHLRGLGHGLKPVVHVGHHGATDALARQIDRALEDHELIKVRVLETCPLSRGEVALWIHRTLGAAVVQIVGRNQLVYRAHPEEPRIRLPR